MWVGVVAASALAVRPLQAGRTAWAYDDVVPAALLQPLISQLQSMHGIIVAAGTGAEARVSSFWVPLSKVRPVPTCRCPFLLAALTECRPVQEPASLMEHVVLRYLYPAVKQHLAMPVTGGEVWMQVRGGCW